MGGNDFLDALEKLPPASQAIGDGMGGGGGGSGPVKGEGQRSLPWWGPEGQGKHRGSGSGWRDCLGTEETGLKQGQPL